MLPDSERPVRGDDRKESKIACVTLLAELELGLGLAVVEAALETGTLEFCSRNERECPASKKSRERTKHNTTLLFEEGCSLWNTSEPTWSFVPLASRPNRLASALTRSADGFDPRLQRSSFE